MTPEQLYKVIEEKALPLVKSYQTDITKHDKESLHEYPGIPFLHFTGDTGSYIWFMPDANDPRWPKGGETVPYMFGSANRDKMLRDILISVKCMKNVNRQDLILYYDGHSIREITQAKAEDIAASHQNRILGVWNKAA